MSAPSRRERRSADSRALILDAAVQCLIDFGYGGATTIAIQERAGVSRGRLLHHFPSRDALLVAAAQHLAADRVRETANRSLAAITARPASGKRIDQAVDLMWSAYRQPYFWGAMELWVAARRDPTLAEALGPAERQLYISIHAATDQMFGEVHTRHPNYHDVRELLLTSMRGVGLTYGFEAGRPERDRHLPMWRAAARALLRPGR